MRTVGFLLLLPAALAADVVLLKDGGKVSGRVTDKGGSVEVATEAGLRTYLKEEVERIVTSPKELLGGSEGLIEEAKRDYEQALASGPAERSLKLKDAVAKATKAREAYAQARELFPEERHTDLDQKLVQVMQLLRLLRDRMGSDVARRGGPAGAAAPPLLLPEAVAVLAAPERRTDPAKRAAARDAFRAYRAMHPEIGDVASAAASYLARPETDWKLDEGGRKALDEYLAGPWLQDPLKTPPGSHLEAARFLSERVLALRKANPQAAVDALCLFGAAHLGHVPDGPEAAAALAAFGLAVRDGVPGTAEGHALRDLNAWIAAGDHDLAVLAFVKEHRAADTPAVRFVWSTALLRLAQSRQRGFERAVAALGTVKAPDAGAAEHLAALAKSIKAVATCSTCAGEGRLRCTNCFGRKEVRFNCGKCMGSGRVTPAAADPSGARPGLGRLSEPVPCYPCRGRGYEKLIKCEKCKDGTVDCRQCDEPKSPPDLSEICGSSPCPLCEGRGLVFRKVLWACRGCLGAGQRLVPRADPSKILP